MGRKDESKHLQKLESRLDEIHELVKGLALKQKYSKRKDSFYPNPYIEKKPVKKWEDFFVDLSMSEVQKKQHEEGTAVSILGHSMNAIIIDILIKINEPLDRQQISSEIEKIKKESSKSIQDKIHGGKDTINFWIKQLLDNEIINQLESKRPIKFEINNNHFFIKFLSNRKRNYIFLENLWKDESIKKSNDTDLVPLWNFSGIRDETQSIKWIKKTIQCPGCEKRLSIPNSYSGALRCPACTIRFIIDCASDSESEFEGDTDWVAENERINLEKEEESRKGELQKTEKISNFYDFVSKILNDKKEKKIFRHHFELVRSLKEWRKQRAGKKPAFIIFNDKTLMELVINLPSNHKELLGISGIGETKIDQFGSELLEFVKKLGRKCKIEKKYFETRWKEYQSKN